MPYRTPAPPKYTVTYYPQDAARDAMEANNAKLPKVLQNVMVQIKLAAKAGRWSMRLTPEEQNICAHALERCGYQVVKSINRVSWEHERDYAQKVSE